MLQQFGLVLTTSALVGSACLLSGGLEEPRFEPKLALEETRSTQDRFNDVDHRRNKTERPPFFQGKILEVREARADDQGIRVGKSPKWFVRILVERKLPEGTQSQLKNQEVPFIVEDQADRFRHFLNTRESMFFLLRKEHVDILSPWGC